MTTLYSRMYSLAGKSYDAVFVLNASLSPTREKSIPIAEITVSMARPSVSLSVQTNPTKDTIPMIIENHNIINRFNYWFV